MYVVVEIQAHYLTHISMTIHFILFLVRVNIKILSIEKELKSENKNWICQLITVRVAVI